MAPAAPVWYLDAMLRVEPALLAGARRAVDEALSAARSLLAGPRLTVPPVPASVNTKAAHDYATDLDLSVEKAIVGALRRRLPGHAIVAEEAGADGLSEDTWFVDPVDGTRNLLTGHPAVAVSVAWWRGDRPVLAALDLPYRDLCLIADASGVRLNGGAFQAPPARLVEHALAVMPGDLRRPTERAPFSALYAALAARFEGVRITGALAYDLAILALGEVDARVSFGPKVEDVAAGVPIIHALGGLVTDLEGRPYRRGPGPMVAARGRAAHAAALAAARAAVRG